ncbi:MAG: phytoene desaturase [Archangium sp.]|nr:phytoene desaturase [Archangium sp.]
MIIGAGVGGLTAAMRLQHAGVQVTLYEKQQGPGGRCGRVEFDGFRFDLGPTILLMPFVLEQTFASVGRKLSDELKLTRCDPHYRVHYRDGSRFTLHSEPNAMAAELERLEPGSAQRYRDFLEHGRKQNDIAFERFITRHFEGLFDFVTPSNVPRIVQVGALQRLWSHVSKFFKDDRLKQALSFQTMYLGISPWEAPAVFSLLPFTEANHGIWFPEGGLHAVPLALERVCREEGVSLNYSRGVRRVLTDSSGRAIGVELEDGTKDLADAVVCNADYAWAVDTLLTGAVREKRKQSVEKRKFTSSGLMLYLGVKGRVEPLLHHNVFFGRDFRTSFDDIFEKLRVPSDVSFYVNAPSRTGNGFAPEGHDALYVLVPVPHTAEGAQKIDWKIEGPRVREQVLTRLAAEGYGDLRERIVSERMITPDDWRTEHFLARGSNFGLAQNFWQIGPFRPRVNDPDVEGLFWCGASIQPGTGVPTVMLSAKFAVDAVLKQLNVPTSEANEAVAQSVRIAAIEAVASAPAGEGRGEGQSTARASP